MRIGWKTFGVALGEPQLRMEEPLETAPAAVPDDLGYEAAHPALQARHWPDALTVKS